MPAKTPQAPSVELVQSLFDPTAAEARVARSLTMGQTVDEIASEKGISSHTVRTHVRGVLEKTGSRRQADVIALGSARSGDDRFLAAALRSVAEAIPKVAAIWSSP